MPLTNTPALAAPIELEAVTTAPTLARLEPAWAALWARCPSATPFQSPAWLVPWWRHFGRHPRAALITLALRRAGRLVGLAPLYIDTAPGSRERSVMLLGTGNTDYLDVLLEPDCEPEGMAAIFGYLDRNWHQWDRCDFQQLPPGSPLLHATMPPRWTDELLQHDACPVLALPDGTAPGGIQAQGADLEACIPASLRKRLRAYWRRAEREHTLAIERARADTVSSLLEALIQLHGARWAERGQPGVLDDMPVRQFHAEAAPALLACGVLRLHALRLDGRIAAVYYGLLHRQRGYYYLSGFAPELDRLSVGHLVVHHAIRDAARERARAFDFLRGQEAYKYRWGATDSITRRRRLHHPNHPKTSPHSRSSSP